MSNHCCPVRLDSAQRNIYVILSVNGRKNSYYIGDSQLMPVFDIVRGKLSKLFFKTSGEIG